MPVSDIRVAPRRVPVVFPATPTSPPLVKNLLINGSIAPPCLEIAGSTQEGAPIWGVRSAERQTGVRLLQEVYEAENNPEGWASYQAYLRDWAAGKTFASFPRHLLPKALQDTKAAMDAVDPWSTANKPDPAAKAKAKAEAEAAKDGRR